jgi:hypothetical protein
LSTENQNHATSTIRPLSNEPWLMFSDFNEAMWQEEHISHDASRLERMMQNFRMRALTAISMILILWLFLGQQAER